MVQACLNWQITRQIPWYHTSSAGQGVPLDVHQPRRKLCCRYCVDCIAEMSRKHYWETVTDEISIEAVRILLVSGNVLKWLAVIRVAKEDNGGDV